jgi:hypothetical protein
LQDYYCALGAAKLGGFSSPATRLQQVLLIKGGGGKQGATIAHMLQPMRVINVLVGQPTRRREDSAQASPLEHLWVLRYQPTFGKIRRALFK